MIANTYDNAGKFLDRVQETLLADEVANNLMLGVCLALARSDEQLRPAPYFASVEDDRGLVMAAVMTPPHNVIVYGGPDQLGDVPAVLVRDLLATQRRVPGVIAPTRVAKALAQAWANLSGEACAKTSHMRVHVLRRVAYREPVPGRLRIATEHDTAWLTRSVLGFLNDVFTEGQLDEARETVKRKLGDRALFVWDDGMPVSMAATTRPTPNGITVSLVFTPPAFRGRRYATACVAALSQKLLDEGSKFCTLFANVSNSAANRVYQRVGYTPVCEYQEYAFHRAVQ